MLAAELERARCVAAEANRLVETLEAAELLRSAREPPRQELKSGSIEIDVDDTQRRWRAIWAENFTGSPTDPRPEQLAMLSSCMNGRSAIVVTAPGRGKTLAITIGGLHHKGKVTILLEPTIELVVEISERLRLDLGDACVMSSHTGDFVAPTSDGAEGEVERTAADERSGEEQVDVDSLRVEYDAGSIEAALLAKNCLAKFVVVTPRLFCRPSFVQCLAELHSAGRLAPPVVDEVHLVAQWGSQFYESYLALKGAIQRAFSGLVGGTAPPSVHPVVHGVTGSMNKRQAAETMRLLGLDADRTDTHLFSLNRPEISQSILDLTDIDGTLSEVLREGTRRIASGCICAAKSIIFVATAAHANLVAAEIESMGLGLEAFPFYRALDNEVAGGRAERRAAWAQSSQGVLVSTILGAHGLHNEEVNFVAWLTLRGDIRTHLQELGRACRLLQRGQAWLARHPRLLEASAKHLDYRSGFEVAALRDMVGFCSAEGTCRRGHLLRVLGDTISPLKSPANHPCCDVCDPRAEALPATVRWVDLQESATALLQEVHDTAASGKRAWFFALLDGGAWRGTCASAVERNSLVFHLISTGALNLDSDGRAVFVTPVKEKVAQIMSGSASVVVACRFNFYIYDSQGGVGARGFIKARTKPQLKIYRS